MLSWCFLEPCAAPRQQVPAHGVPPSLLGPPSRCAAHTRDPLCTFSGAVLYFIFFFSSTCSRPCAWQRASVTPSLLLTFLPVPTQPNQILTPGNVPHFSHLSPGRGSLSSGVCWYGGADGTSPAPHSILPEEGSPLPAQGCRQGHQSILSCVTR